ncbi:bifunctional demethylmenaquinone methyltransferase/2-methoxy-6-polyprenyl-1,4-benzoquinol methylase UbiE [uncultured Sanguibacteroides sp.]|uniref:bifunctional demethylmenaquinone methyltransferase/2-methoxy-6-polyprenyl-1,4-benzoquinol methylase UbiE n=1 Tax=uncultured Sanguibacteroides sp. TaxID=1635151 RepID=UPI0025FE0293|nr:bifunctional demethylmenaquinone methyltransferase/2-methoxy-6-polyprenyl-1,4-benzoquinol methylase UbiE [uncultured Sanguibacteroides sp.]
MAKKERVQEMFNGIAPKYDLLNHLLSMGIDKRWRKKAMKVVGAGCKDIVLDVACGTGDFSMEALKHGVKKVIGADISENMLTVAREKAKERKLTEQLDFRYGDSENLEFPDNTFDAVTVAFGVRNFEHLEKGLTEMYRVLKPGGKVVILEFSTPERFPMKQLYRFYFKRVLPWIGGIVSGNRKAYEYLPASVFAFPQGEAFLKIMRSCGYRQVTQCRLTFGIASLYVGEK